MDQVRVFAPGSVSNLGPGFDCLGIAFTGRGDFLTARRSDRPGVRVASVSDARIPLEAARNTAAIAASAVLRRAHSAAGLELSLEKGLSLAAGMGGSAASAVAGALAADAILEARLSRRDLLLAALEAEEAVSGRHADNVAPCLFGGGVLVTSLERLEITPVRVDPSVSLALVTPAYEVATAGARVVLPRDVPRGDAVGQAARLASLVLGLERGEPELIRRSMLDAIAEPARAGLYPGYPEARAAGLEAGAWGVAVSGAGPTLVALVSEGAAEGVSRSMIEAYYRAGIAASAHVARVDAAGARVVG